MDCLVGEGGIVECEFFDGFAHVLDIGAFGIGGCCRVEVAEDHLLCGFVAFEGLWCGVVFECDCVADADIGEGFDCCDDVASFAGADLFDFLWFGYVFTNFGDLECSFHGHHSDFVSDFE